MGLFSRLFDKRKHVSGSPDPHSSEPPEWTAAPEPVHAHGKYRDAPENEFEDGERFCERFPVEEPKLLSSQILEYIRSIGCKAWGMQQPSTWRFKGTITSTEYGTTIIQTYDDCESTCVLGDIPILAGLYDFPAGMEGVYYEVTITKMGGAIAVGTACQPYPDFRFPGWNRLSAGFHLDDMRKFFEDPDGGRDYVPEDVAKRIREGDVVGCGYEVATGALFFTLNGRRLPNAFTGVYLPRTRWDVYAAIGVEGGCEVEVNFGGDVFRWKEGNSWKVDQHIGRLGGTSRAEEAPPAYVL